MHRRLALTLGALLFASAARADTPLDLPMTRVGSGTAWQPDDIPMYAHHFMAGDWMLMLHYALAGGYDHQSGRRGDDQAYGLGWVMAMASHDLAGGELMLRAMLSPEPPFVGRSGYSLLLQSGEAVDGVPLHDRQHPHDLFMEVAASYAHELTPDVAFLVYGALSGEPALGPVAFPHRSYALYDMFAALGHHWEDSTHVSFGVVTAALYTRRVKLEGSWFNGREPDAERYDFDLRTPDSFSARLTVNPSSAWSAQVSFGHLDSPEELEPGVSQDRLTASLTYATPRTQVTLVYGRDMPSQGPNSNALLLEANSGVSEHVTIFGRAEWVQKTGEDLSVSGDRFDVGAVSVGAVYELAPVFGVVPGIGVRGTLDLVGRDLEDSYGRRTPWGLSAFVEIHPAGM